MMNTLIKKVGKMTASVARIDENPIADFAGALGGPAA
jgi:hypothetical protein